MKCIAPLFLVITLIAISPLVVGDTLLLDSIAETPDNSTIGILRPSRGQSMEQVYSKFGQAQKEVSAVGKPPITRWVYEKFTVYFEHNHVIETVIHR